MVYETFLTENFFSKVTTENQAVNILWGLKFDGMEFKCCGCGKHVRLRAGNIFQNS